MVGTISGSHLQSEVSSTIDSIGQKVEVYYYDPTYNDRGDAQNTYSDTPDATPMVIPVAESDVITKEGFGEVREGQPTFIFKGDATISEGDKIVWKGDDHKVLDTDIVPLQGVSVVTHVQATLMSNT